MRKLTFLCSLIILAVFPVVALATTITFSSDLLNEGNNINSIGANQCVAPVGAWATLPAGACWVSFSNTGQGGVSPPNTTIGGTPTAVFTESITLPYGDNSGWFQGWADDTMSVTITNALHPGGLLLHPANDVWAPNCTGQPIGCVQGMDWRGTLDNTILSQGVNTFSMSAYQLWGDGFAVAYQGEVNSTPEPATTALIGFGLIGLGALRFRKLKLRRQ
jgi:hypothetical protein